MKRFKESLGALVVCAAVAAWCAGCGTVNRYDEAPPMAFGELNYGAAVQTATLDGVEVAYIDEGGRDAAPLVLVHGLGEHVGYWRHNVGPLSARYRVVALDLPGYGRSSKPAAEFSMRGYAETVRALMDHLGIDRAVVVGHSMGGQVALTFALRHPERLEGLILAAPAGIEAFDEGEAAFLRQHTTTESIKAQGEDAIRGNYRNNLFFGWKPEYEALVKERVRLGRSEEFERYAWAVVQGVRAMLAEPVRGRLGEIQAPTLVVFGYQDALIPNPFLHGGETKAVGEEAAGAIPNAELVMVDGAGHRVQYERPEKFNDVVIRWLQASVAWR